MAKNSSETDPVILGLGSNRSWNSMDSYAILDKAIEELGKILSELKCAPFYETEPLPKSDQNNFINTAVSGFFNGGPDEMLDCIHMMEAMFGRDRSAEIRWGERSLDIDILLFGRQIINSPRLTIPHPRLEERRFALEPLIRLLPRACSPVTGISYQTICKALPDQGVRLINPCPLPKF